MTEKHNEPTAPQNSVNKTKLGYPRIYLGNAVDSLLSFIAVNNREILESIHNLGLKSDDSYNSDDEETHKEIHLSPEDGISGQKENEDKCLSPIKELKEIIENYSLMDFDLLRPVVINLTMILDPCTSLKAQSMLLKFLEETHHKVIILSTHDNLLPTLLARAQAIIKNPEISPYSFEPAFTARLEMELDNNGIYIPKPLYERERLKRSVEMSRVDLFCIKANKGRGFRNRVAYILEHK